MKKVAIVYTHFPHYREAVFRELINSKIFDFTLYYDSSGVDQTIVNGGRLKKTCEIKNLRFGPFVFQMSSIALILKNEYDSYIFLGNPYILSTWIAAVLARIRGKPIFFWTHGWQSSEVGFKKAIRMAFYNLASGLLLYGNRAYIIGSSEGYPKDKMTVIYNSLDYSRQKKLRDKWIASIRLNQNQSFRNDKYFLIVSRLVKDSLIHLAIHSITKINNQASLIIVGDGPERGRLEFLAKNIKANVLFLNAIYDENKLASLFLGACAVVSPGKVGLLAMHALGYGVPVITHGDFSKQMPEAEAIIPGITGSFFEYEDISDMAEKMKIYIKKSHDDFFKNTCSNAAISTIEKYYTAEVQCSAIVEYIHKFIK